MKTPLILFMNVRVLVKISYISKVNFDYYLNINMKNILFFAFLIVSHASIAQNTVGTIINSVQAASGYTLLAPVNSQQTYLIDNCGREIKRWNSNFQMGMSAYLMEDGSLYRAGRVFNSDMMMGGIGGVLEKYDWNGNLSWQYYVSAVDSVSHHDFKVLPNGNILMLVAYKKPIAEAFELGKDTLNYVDSTLYDEAIVEIQPLGIDSAQIVWQWNVWDHLVQNQDSTKLNYGIIAEHPNRMNINYLGTSTGRDWMHANSLDYNPQLNQIIISFRNTSEFWIIDHSTTLEEAAGSTGGIYGKGGDILYRWGNPAAYDRGINLDQDLIGQHKVTWIEDGLPGEGNILLFNNGDNSNYSSVLELVTPIISAGFYLNPGSIAFGPDQPIWTYNDSLNALFNSGRLSSAQRQSNGNTLICSGQNGNLTEVDNQNNIVWNYLNPISSTGAIEQGNLPGAGSNSIFLAYKYEPDFPAFIGKNLEPGNPLELNFNLDNCSVANLEQIEKFNQSEIQIFPNPVKDNLFIKSSKKIVEIQLFSSEGKVIQIKEMDSLMQSINLTDLDNGFYIIHVVNEAGEEKSFFITKN